MNKILVTGGAGYVGSICVEKLIKDRKNLIVVIDNLEKGHRQALNEAPRSDDRGIFSPRFVGSEIPPKRNSSLPSSSRRWRYFAKGDKKSKFVKGNIANNLQLDRLFKKYRFDTVIHFAAKTLVRESFKKPYEYFKNNVSSGLGLLEVMRKYNCRRIIYSSSASVYGNPLYSPIDEAHPASPISPYAESKLAFEKILIWYQKLFDFKLIIFRYFNPAGATKLHGEDHRPETHLIPIVLDCALGKRKAVNIFGGNYDTPDGTCIRDFVHVEDIASAHTQAIGWLEKSKKVIFNIGSEKGYSVKEVVETCQKVTGVKIATRMSQKRPGDPARLVASSKLIKKEFAWLPKASSLEKIIKSAWDWKKAHPEGYPK